MSPKPVTHFSGCIDKHKCILSDQSDTHLEKIKQLDKYDKKPGHVI